MACRNRWDRAFRGHEQRHSDDDAFTLPTTDGSANQVLTTDGSGNVSWTTQIDTNTNTNQLTTFVVQDGDSTNVTMGQGKYLKFAEGGAIDVNFTDTNGGTSGDPYDLTISHADTSSQGSVNNSNGTVIQDVTLDECSPHCIRFCKLRQSVYT